MRKNEIEKIEEQVMGQLKDFQRATVERIDELFRNGQNRVLVADEVGLGKTMIAKGVIAKMASLRKEEKDDVFKVIYVCSNQSIANQNLSKLNIFSAQKDEMSSSRLSMQFYYIKESEKVIKERKSFVQMITLTPETSFRQSNGSGTYNERILIGCILDQLFDNHSYFASHKSLLKRRLHQMLNTRGAQKWATLYAERAKDVNKKFPYKSDIHKGLIRDDDFFRNVKRYLLEQEGFKSDSKFISYLRRKFAEVSVEMLNPDLIIMDEFQRFKFLIHPDEDDASIATLVEKFLKPRKRAHTLANKVRVLLLSATPYKLYSTLEEIGETNQDEHYKEFKDVVYFLKDNPDKEKKFDEIWGDYSKAIHELKNEDSAILILKSKVQAAESELYEGMCRTERISVMESKDFVDDKSKDISLKITANDIKSYLDAAKLINAHDIKVKFSLDYIKSCPYIFSFMNTYEMKKGVCNYFKRHPDEINDAKSSLLWLNYSDIRGYKSLEAVNSRLERLKSEVFGVDGVGGPKNPELLLWVPPSMPYYEFGGVYRKSEFFSKMLIFSSWEMVPRMIGGLISYEEEVKTIGRLVKKRVKEREQDSVNYFQKRRYPQDRLLFKQNGVIALLFPSSTLASMYRPSAYVDGVPEKMEQLERRIWQKVVDALRPIRNHYCKKDGDEDGRWYWLAPALMDGVDSSRKKISALLEQVADKDLQRSLKEIYDDADNINLGKEPADLEHVLVDLVIGGLGVCAYRNLKDADAAVKTALAFKRYFGSPEKTAIVELANNTRKFDDNYHWQDVLLYCKNGNFQAMLDEYVHLLKADVCGTSSNWAMDIASLIDNSLGLNTANYSVQSFNHFKNEINESDDTRFGLRTHYAVAFVNTKNDSDGSVTRKDALRKTFNSPFWPFVLATTSIGQEGLDFHLYCRKIMHWNLPTNPIDLEQREGRINRFKCLAIRQNVAKEYAPYVNPSNSSDIWEDMFNLAHKKKKNGQSDLIPYWCLGDKQDVKIERILAHYPISKDQASYERLVKILSLYRLTLGQARQEDLLEYVFREFESTEKLKELFINLSPFSKKR